MIITIVKVTLPNRILSFKGLLKYLVVSSILRFFLALRQKKDIPQKVGKQLSRWPKAWCHGGFSTRNSVIFQEKPFSGDAWWTSTLLDRTPKELAPRFLIRLTDLLPSISWWNCRSNMLQPIGVAKLKAMCFQGELWDVRLSWVDLFYFPNLCS